MDDPGDLVPISDGAKGVEVGKVRLLDRHASLEEGRRCGSAVPADDDGLAQVDQRQRGVGAERAEPAGEHSAHRSLTPPRALGIRVWKSISATQVGRTAIRAMRVPGWSICAR